MDKKEKPTVISQKLTSNLAKFTAIVIAILISIVIAISFIKNHRTIIKSNSSNQNFKLKTVTTFDGIKLKINDDAFSHDSIISEYKKSEVAKYLKNNVKRGDTIVDVSNDIGIYILFMAKLIEQSGRIYVYNPCFKYVNSINASSIANGFENRILTQCLGISDHTYDGLLIYKNNFPSMSGRLEHKDTHIPTGYSAVSVKISSIDEQLPNLQNIDFLIIGANDNASKVIDGAIRLIKKSNKIKILLSFNNKTLCRHSSIGRLMLIDFKLFLIQKDGSTKNITINEFSKIKNGHVVLER